MDTKDVMGALGFTVLGCFVGGIVGTLLGWVFAELFTLLLVDPTPEGLLERIEDYGVELYSAVFPGLGYLAGFIIGGASSLVLHGRVNGR